MSSTLLKADFTCPDELLKMLIKGKHWLKVVKGNMSLCSIFFLITVCTNHLMTKPLLIVIIWIARYCVIDFGVYIVNMTLRRLQLEGLNPRLPFLGWKGKHVLGGKYSIFHPLLDYHFFPVVNENIVTLPSDSIAREILKYA